MAKIPVIPEDHLSEQQPPKPSSGDMWLLVLKDMEEMRLQGIEKYGTPVQPFNGRDPLVDAYQEALDMCVYLRQAIEERKLNDVTQLVVDIKKYVIHHGKMMGECVAWNKLKKLVGVE